MAQVDDDGSIIVLGRGVMCINTGGEKVFPEEVEQALKGHPAVMDALVAGVPDERFRRARRRRGVAAARHVGRHGRVAGALQDDAGRVQGAGQDRVRHPGNALPPSGKLITAGRAPCSPAKNRHLPGHRDPLRVAIICLTPLSPSRCSAGHPHAGSTR